MKLLVIVITSLYCSVENNKCSTIIAVALAQYITLLLTRQDLCLQQPYILHERVGEEYYYHRVNKIMKLQATELLLTLLV